MPLKGKKTILKKKKKKIITVNVDIFAQLNFRASSPRCHFRVDKFSRILQLILFALLLFIFSRKFLRLQ